ncbi:HK97 family phage prohead protease [Microbacterium sp. PAMC21962]|uniref:HK97 family phage prohead protease n=1 Tax=Microbacterium sp. PAMC21962 TaxID=2861280 RepID=UPI001C62F094|nr:HK97 family phage prohead protease [Microbacterium sp. PAMC21962]QYF98915.1 HK97 family phage prohead protease [Microbacterium sp. PAMC21962]
MLTKTVDVEIKAIGAEGDGRFQAYASTFDVVDTYGDMVIKGAFLESLAEYGKKGEGIPLYWRHRMDDPFMLIGQTIEAKEDSHGLWVDCTLLDTNNAKQVYALLKAGLVRQMSFAYDVVEAGWVEKTVDGKSVSYYELRKLRIHEVSVVPVGANQETEILAVKAARDAAIAALEDDRQKADEAPASAGADIQGTADEPSDAKTEEPPGAKAEEPKTEQSKRHLGLITIATAL